MRAALLPTPGDPFVLSYWIRNFNRVWKDEVDELRILVNGGRRADLTVVLDGVCKATFVDHRIGHGEALQRLLADCQAEEVMLVEDDAYVRVSGVVRTAFEMMKSTGSVLGSVLGSPRGGYSPDLEKPALDRWGPSISPDGSTGYGIWPCFLFADRAALLGVAKGFTSRSWPIGSTIPGLDYTCRTEMHTDTMTAAAFMLRDRYLVVPIPQYKEIEQKALVVERNAPWFHAGGLSNFDPYRGFTGDRPDIGGSNEGRDWASRVWWWRRAAKTAGLELEHLKAKYLWDIDVLVEETGIADQVEEWDAVYPACITWDDQA